MQICIWVRSPILLPLSRAGAPPHLHSYAPREHLFIYDRSLMTATLPDQALTFQPGIPFLHPTAEKMNKYITCTGSQDERGVQDELCCRQCPHSPVHSDPARTPVVWDPANTPKVTSLASWQNSMQYIYDAFLPEKDSLWSHAPKPPAYF